MYSTFRFIIITTRKHEHTSQLYFPLIKMGPMMARIVCIMRANNESNKYMYIYAEYNNIVLCCRTTNQKEVRN